MPSIEADAHLRDPGEGEPAEPRSCAGRSPGPSEGQSGRRARGDPSLRQLIRRFVILAVFIGLVIAAITSVPGLGELRHRFDQVGPAIIVLVGLSELASCLSDVACFRDVISRRLGWRFSYDLAMAEQAANVLVPTGGAGGLVLGAVALHEEGMDAEAITRRSVAFFILTSIPNFACVALGGLLLLLGVTGDRAPLAVTLAFTLGAWFAFGLVAALPSLLDRLGPDRPGGPLATRLAHFAHGLAAGVAGCWRLLREPRWVAIAGSIGFLGFDILALGIAFVGLGGGPGTVALVFAYSIGQLGGLIPIPAGIGAVDGGMVGALLLYGSPVSAAVAAVLLYRVFQIGIPTVLGLLSFYRLRHEFAGQAPPNRV
jgi:uncharacterized membrane protein YbhN (UPF0104 family)